MHNKYIHYDYQTTDRVSFIVNVPSNAEQAVKPEPDKCWFFDLWGVGVIRQCMYVFLNSSKNEICEHVYIHPIHDM
jgi:hypothetical protein